MNDPILAHALTLPLPEATSHLWEHNHPLTGAFSHALSEGGFPSEGSFQPSHGPVGINHTATGLAIPAIKFPDGRLLHLRHQDWVPAMSAVAPGTHVPYPGIAKSKVVPANKKPIGGTAKMAAPVAGSKVLNAKPPELPRGREAPNADPTGGMYTAGHPLFNALHLTDY